MADNNKTTEVILLHESWRESVKSDATTFATIALVIGLGSYLESSAMQWVGFVFVILSVVGRSVRKGNKHRMTVKEARQRLDEIERSAS